MMKTMMIICAIVLAAALLLSIRKAFSMSGASYENADKYTAGDADITGTVHNIDIRWTSGKVHIAYHADRTVTLRETANKTLSDSEKLRWWLDGDTLRVQYEKPGLRLFSFLEKELTLTLPEGTVLGDAQIKVTSGAIDFPSLEADVLRLSATSGEIAGTAEAREISAGMTSGRTELKVVGKAETVSVSGTSGRISLDVGEAGDVRIGLTSGDVKALVNAARTLEIASTSGSVDLSAGRVQKAAISCTSGGITAGVGQFEALDFHSTSGGIRVSLPAEPGFTAELHTTSGDTDFRLPMTKEGKNYIVGDGSGSVKLHTTSGDIFVDAR